VLFCAMRNLRIGGERQYVPKRAGSIDAAKDGGNAGPCYQAERRWSG
jgi:hypothetical protein